MSGAGRLAILDPAAEVLRRSRRLAGLPPDNISMNDDTAIPLTHNAAASTSATDTAQGGRRPRQPNYWAPEPRIFSGIAEDVYSFLITKENLNTPSTFRQQCRAFEALKTRRILPKCGRLDNVPTVASMNVATCEDIPFLVRRVVREELVLLQAGDVHHQCSFATCPEPPPYWMRKRHVENRPRTETADFTPWLPFSPTCRGHHRMSSSRRAAADLRPSSTRPLPEDYYASSQNLPAEHDPSPRTSATSAPANKAASTPTFFGVSGSYVRNACPATFFDAPASYARNLDLSPGRPPSPTAMA
ncbi:hypothetical protein HPB51_016839 [Rhipicephalus microplus]|uniref:Uncharacterized protein n=1 Tax=Rhipicephalus microplus TaxID=6941 RepID=A0A9J6DPD1_RHIMP|nr:hypothetical protein HPB51_016839 [Rhipicephalus microplus]